MQCETQAVCVGSQLGGAPLAPATREEMHGAVARLSSLALATGRMPVMPLVPCDSPWIHRADGAFHGIRDHEVRLPACRHPDAHPEPIPALSQGSPSRIWKGRGSGPKSIRGVSKAHSALHQPTPRSPTHTISALFGQLACSLR
jgi:hypothetical protein